MVNAAALGGWAMARLPRLAEIAMVVLLAWIVAGWLVPDDGGAPAPAESGKDAADFAWDVKRIADASLFGRLEAHKPKPAPAAPKPPPAPARLDAKLLGTVVAGAHSAAVLKLAREREQRVFFIGDEVAPGVVLREVLADAVILDRGGRRERLALEQGEGLSVAPPVAKAPPPPPPGGPRVPIRRINRPVSRGMIERGIRDFPRLLSQARVTPHFVDGKADGFVISNIVPGSLYEQVGLRNGDVIRKVNGQQVTSAQQAMAMYQALEKATSIDLEIDRAGQTLQLHYDIR